MANGSLGQRWLTPNIWEEDEGDGEKLANYK